jgi:hypothetical protein
MWWRYTPVTRWTELALALAILASVTSQAPPPGELVEADVVQRAILLEFAELYADPSSDGAIIERLAAGTVLDYVGETTDAFGRTWYTVRDPNRYVRRRDTYLVPFDRRQFAAFGNRGAVLADRRPGSAVTRVEAGASDEEEDPWWQPVEVLELGHNASFDATVGITALAPREADVRELIALLGGMDAIADWPADALPGQLFVPAMVPAIFQFDGAEWEMVLPVRLVGDALDLLGNGVLRVDRDTPPPAGGPVLYCWELVGALDPRNELAGSLAVAAPMAAPRSGAPLPPDMGAFDPLLAPEALLDVLPPAPPETRVPPRVDQPPPPSGVLLEDNDSRQAVYLQQRIDPALTRRLRGQSLIVDVVARNAPRSQSAATFGVDVEVGFGELKPAVHFATSFTSAEAKRRFEWPFDVPEDAETLIVRLLPLDRTLAVEQQGSVVFERASLRRASWEAEPPAASFLLYRATASAFEGARLYTRAPIAVSTRPVATLQRVWTRVVTSGWSDEDKVLALAGELRQGMTMDQVRAAWGNPGETIPGRAENQVSWNYPDRYAFFEDEKLVIFRPRPVVEADSTLKICPGGAPAEGKEERP